MIPDVAGQPEEQATLTLAGNGPLLEELRTAAATAGLADRIHFPGFLDQEALRFFPFQAGLGLRPRGFLQHLRIGTYKLSQWARPSSDIPPFML